MKPAFLKLSLVAILLALNACKTTSPQADNVGPFDANGNYVEAWADDPSKWRAYKPKDVEGDPPVVAKNEQPPDHSIPLAPSNSTPVKPVTSSPPPRPDTDHVVSRTTNKPRTSSTASNSTKPRTSSTASNSTKPRTSSTSTKPKPKTTVAKAKPKPKQPTVARHTVKKGDSLSSLASKYGSSVSAIQKANGLSGTLIRDGKTLVIPRKK